MILKDVLNFCLNIFFLAKANFYIIIYKILNKKIVVFFHPKKELTINNLEYVENFFSKYKNFYVIYVSTIYIKRENYFFVKSFLIEFIYGANLFISNIVSDKFTPGSRRIYIHHDIYDTPLVEINKEKQLKERLSKYNFIVVASNEGKRIFKELLKESKVQINVSRYLKLDYFLNNIKIKKSKKIKNILIAPTDFKTIPMLSIQSKLKNIIKILLKAKYFVTYRPHPSNLKDKKTIYIKSFFVKNKNFKFDDSPNYLKTFENSDTIITDLSGTAYTFLVLNLKPIIFFSINENYLLKTNYIKLYYFKNRSKLGYIAKNEYNLLKVLKFKNFYKLKQKKILKFRNKFFKEKKLNLNDFLKKS